MRCVRVVVVGMFWFERSKCGRVKAIGRGEYGAGGVGDAWGKGGGGGTWKVRANRNALKKQSCLTTEALSGGGGVRG